MADQEAAAKRAVGLTKLFNGIIHGHRDLKSALEGNRFLEALRSQEDVSKCVESLVASKAGLDAIGKAFRFSPDDAFLNGPAASSILHFSHPSLKQLYGGQFLNRILEQIVQPPTFWNTLVKAHDARNLSSDATHAFAWLLLETLHSRSEDVPDVREIAEEVTKNESLIKSESLDVRNIGYKIKHAVESSSSDSVDGPGGRHDNDFDDFRKIKILPTADEFASSETPFYRRADAIDSVLPGNRGSVHLDNQFRLLREDLLGELRNDFQIATGQKKGRRKTVLTNLQFVDIDCGPVSRRKPCSLRLRVLDDIPQLRKVKGVEQRKRFVSDKANKNLMKNRALGCLVSNGNIVAFANVERDEALLAEQPAIIVLHIVDADSVGRVLLAWKHATDMNFVQVDTAAFSYEPILKCLQSMIELPLHEQLVGLQPDDNEQPSEVQPYSIIDAVRNTWQNNLQPTLNTSKPVELDATQAESLLAGLERKVSLIQGPPGTWKSFIGALIAKILHDHTSETILVLTYTNHALDQFLVDLQDIGIPSNAIVRLGSNFTPATQSLALKEQHSSYRMSMTTRIIVDELKVQVESYHDALTRKVDHFSALRRTNKILLEYLEFSEDSEFFDAFVVPESDDKMALVGKKGRIIDKTYLVQRWINGQDAGVFQASAEVNYPSIWAMSPQARITLENRWYQEIENELITEVTILVRKYNECCERLTQLFREKQSHTIGNKRIIGCTTTGAAMFTDAILKASPGVILVEEAGEILESHVLAAMTANTKQLVLIGDHKQLRPKVSNYSLTVEKGHGYNLNVSLFERLVLAGVPHTTLNKQHRMRPEISSLIRFMTYHELEDAETTRKRPALRGFQDNVMFVSHDRPEVNADRIADRRDGEAKSSKENTYEADMVLKCVRYLGQQGYGTDDIVVLTPYLGQLYLLVNTLSAENDPVLNDLDSHELIRAGLLSPASGQISKRRLRVSTIDNYQGDESNIVIVCLTRSNSIGDIGFMSSPMRVNVMLSRARNALIMIGNPQTFMNSRKGQDVWVPLLTELKSSGYVYDGFPVKCEQHPDKTALLTEKEQFNSVCPDGGCSEPCGKMLNCNIHTCPHRCHQLQDHSKMKCETIIWFSCPKDHKTSRRCYDKAAAAVCRKCDADARALEKRRQRDYKLDQDRQAKQQVYAARLAEIEDELEHAKRVLRDQNDENDRQYALAQKRQDLANLRSKASNPPKQPTAGSTTAKSPIATSNKSSIQSQDIPTAPRDNKDTTQEENIGASEEESQPDWDKSEAKDDWEQQKQFDGAENEALDSLMSMIGLESVKEQFLTIKNKVDTVVRQGISLKGERFGAALLGNPGTGKTTVARLYAKFLVKVGALPGDHFFETSGSSLANDGVPACKAHIEKILEEGGGIFFIDEAYQLVSGNSYGGKAVLDYLLTEIENLVGKVVFVLAGYHKQMEAFFAHNPGIPSRIPLEMEFQDYTDEELQRIFCQYIDSKYRSSMKIEGGMNGLYVRIVARRVGRGRGRDGFGNARAVQNKIGRITEQQAKRLRKQRKAGKLPDDNFLTKEDLIGPEPATTLKNNAAWTKLQKMIGLASVKQSVQSLLDGIQFNYQRELEEKPLVQYSLNRNFIGSPGTGKTSIAKLYGKILADIGLLSNGEVVIKNPADFVGNVLGASEANTKGILASTVGKVLIIDEAYMLAGTSVADPYKAAVVDTIVAEVQSTPGEDRCVLLLGYKDQMEEMFRDANPGLARRFPIESAFVFEDFNDAELRQILDLKLKDIGFNATDQAKRVAMDVLQRARNRPNFGNAGEVDIILDRAKGEHQKNMSAGKSQDFDTFDAIDFDPDFDRGERAATNLPALFQNVVGCEDLIKQFQGYQTTAANMKALGMDPREQLPFNFLFKGPPGTGKTTTAQKMGKIFYDMGLLSQAKVVECSATDLIGQYVGQTGPKVQKLLEKALGKVLFIDEAYRLAEGAFATEAMDELVDCLTKPKFAQKLVTVLAGYDKDIDRLMSMNPGLTSRFPEAVIFSHLDPETCLELLIKVLEDLQKKKKAPLDLSVVEVLGSGLNELILDYFRKLSDLGSWGNARDVKSLAKSMFGKLISAAVPPVTSLVLTEPIIINTMQTMFDERSRRNEAAGTSRFPNRIPIRPAPQPQPQTQKPPIAHAPETKSAPPPTKAPPPTAQKQDKHLEVAKTVKPKEEPEDPLDSILKATRDAGVSDAIWNQLERDKRAIIAKEREYRRLQEEKRQEEQRIEELWRAEKAAADEEERRLREQERIAAELERRRREAILIAAEKERKKEMEAQKRLRIMGPCPAGYHWIKQGMGYRCAGGSHWIDDAAVWQ
ncbi:P-loop containing nucleoside triphosphate hydrolase protein [Dothidotthia symphoricarpi CBS 119687]|uniref:P-loop containing nucleoside triphosphate hydrolase protein n=1 Tax=Dothidotthia symphoricarpi CBS 119687 TaxID=1392245 RepID=A0A6A6AA19_9PLEO|nr:P-loop containing nucleoside triphosphate hydrolase protein [Dothidotthia symphoricarpi CBS 119687]KAF2127934.1 P-loop containing nucleoside triphosphate hydrolase protein [Dothidotthia symphoricarpi CBS 119687]